MNTPTETDSNSPRFASEFKPGIPLSQGYIRVWKTISLGSGIFLTYLSYTKQVWHLVDCMNVGMINLWVPAQHGKGVICYTVGLPRTKHEAPSLPLLSTWCITLQCPWRFQNDFSSAVCMIGFVWLASYLVIEYCQVGIYTQALPNRSRFGNSASLTAKVRGPGQSLAFAAYT